MLADDLDEWLSASEAEEPEQIPEVFSEFCAWLGIKLEPGQSAIAKVAFDRLNPGDLTGEERDIALSVFGGVETVPDNVRSVFVGVCGARGGKSYVLVALRALHLAMTAPLPRQIAANQKPAVVIVAPDMKLSREPIESIEGAIRSHPLLEERLVNCVYSPHPEIVVSRGNQRIRISALAAGHGGLAGRGRWLLGFFMDETAFFKGENYKVSDMGIFEACLSRMPVGSQAVVVSTPYAESGLLYQKWAENYGDPQNALVCQAPTLTLRDNEDTRHAVAMAFADDPNKAERECNAKFVSAGTSQMFDSRAISDAVNRGREAKFPRLPSGKGVVEVGADFGFRTDSSAIVAVELMPGNRYQVLVVGEERPKDGPLKPSVVVADFARVMKKVGADTMMADGHYRESIQEHLEDVSLFFRPAPSGANGKADTYNVARLILSEGRLDLPDHPRLIQQMREVTKRPTSGGGVSIDSPRWRAGGHGDLVSALVLALYAAHQHEVPEARVELKKHSPEWWRQLEEDRFNETIEKRQREMEDEQDNSWIMGP